MHQGSSRRSHLILNERWGSGSVCTVLSHQSSAVVGLRAGWYIPAGPNARAGYYSSPYLPVAEDGGPISALCAAKLSDPVDPFSLTVGQWKFVMDEWLSVPVVVEHEGESGGEGDHNISRQEVRMGVEKTLMKQHKDKGLPSRPGFWSLEARDQADEFPQLIGGFSNLSVGGYDNQDHGSEPMKGNTKSGGDKLFQGQREDDAEVYEGDTGPKARKDYDRGLEQRLVAESRRVDQLMTALSQVQAALAGGAYVDAKIRQLVRTQEELSDQVEAILHDTSDPEGEIQTMVSRIEQLEASLQAGRGVSRHGVSFSSPGEIGGFLRASGGMKLGMFHDVVSLLHSIGANAMTHKSALITLKAQRDAKFETDLEARVFTSFRTSFPAILCGGSSTVESVEDHVRLEDRLKNYKVWYADDGTSGVSQRMLAGVVEIEKRVSRMAREVTRDPVILRFVNGLVGDSVHFVREMVSFINQLVSDYRDQTFLNESQVWSLAVSFLEQIFSDMRAARCPIQDAAETDSALLVWGILKCHEIGDEYLKHGFQHHPSLSGLLVQTLMHTGPGGGGNSKAAEAKMSQLSNKVLAKVGGLDDLKARIVSLESRIGKLE